MNQHFRYAAGILLAAFVFQNAYSQSEIKLGKEPDSKLALIYNAGASVRFDNTEYSGSDDFVPSRTLFGIRAEAALGLKYGTDKVNHRIIAGITPLYEFGGGWQWSPLLYYKLNLALKNCDFAIAAGAFARERECLEFYSDALFSSRDRFTRATFNGLQFSWTARKYRFELGVDWMGMISPKAPSRREEFKIYSGGHYDIFKWMKFGYGAYLHHYACSQQATNVCDDAVLNPYMEFEFATMAPVFQSLMLRVGVLAGYQCDRAEPNEVSTPVNGNIYARLRKWNVIIDNDLYFGGNMMPLYDKMSPEGMIYGENLYMSDGALRRRDGESFGYFDRLGIAYEPRWDKMAADIAPYLVDKFILRLRVNLDFNSGYIGTQQLIEIAYKF